MLRKTTSIIICLMTLIGIRWSVNAQQEAFIRLETALAQESKINLMIVPHEGQTCHIDWGNGNKETVSTTNIRGTLKGNYIAIWGDIKGLSATDAGITAINVSLPRIEILNLNDNKLTSLSLPSLPTLTSLAIADNKVGDLRLTNYPKLKTLNVSGNTLSTLTLEDLPSLSTLIITNNQLTELNLASLPTLLSLRGNKSGLARITLPPSIKEAHLEHNRLSDAKAFENLPTLHTLRLGGNPIPTFTTKQCPALQNLELYDCGLRDLRLDAHPRLRLLDLMNNQLSKDVLERIYTSLPEQKGGQISVEGNADASKAKSALATDKGWSIDVKQGVEAQRTLVEGTDYELTEDGEGLARWYAFDLNRLDMTEDEQLAKVKRIEDRAFFLNEAIQYVILPSSLESIGSMAFANSALKEIKLPRSLKRIGYTPEWGNSNPFSECLSLTKIELEEGNRYFSLKDACLLSKNGEQLIAYTIGHNASKVTIPEGVVEIHPWAFGGALYLKEVICPQSLKRIADYAFIDAGLVEQINLNEGLEHIGWAALARTAIRSLSLPKSFTPARDGYEWVSPTLGCTKLSQITLHEGNQHCSLIDGALYADSGRTLLSLAPADAKRSFTLPSSVKQLAMGAMAYHQTLEEVYIRQHIALPLRVLDGCAALHTLVLATGSPDIQDQALSDCSSLQTLSLMGVTPPKRIAEDAFEGVTAKGLTIRVPNEKSADYQYLLKRADLSSATLTEQEPQYTLIDLKRAKQTPLNLRPMSSFADESLVAVSEKKDLIEGNIIGETSLIVGEDSAPSSQKLYLIRVAPRHNHFVEPYLWWYDRTRSNITRYEEQVAKRKPISEEEQFGGVMITFASSDPNSGYNVKYLFFGDEASIYTNVVFERKSVFESMKMPDFFAERYTPAQGTDTEGESFNGFARLERIGYEYRELDVDTSSNDPTVNIAYFLIKECNYTPVKVHVGLSEIANPDIQIIRSNVKFSQGYHGTIRVYTIDGKCMYRRSLSGESEVILPSLPTGHYILFGIDEQGKALKLKFAQ